ncbi:MAG TPA: serine/threonine-protein kinase [Pyrinomonadaceae bacterium]|nr:serine/threonine-protein kinase [Pyrinomonadaceae bacterium]
MTGSHETRSNPSDSTLAADALLQGRYRVVRQLGRGGMGAVYEAVDERLGITVALKETLSTESAMRKQFEHEARLLASMQHPALPRVSDHFVEGNRAFLVMQFIGGTDLARIIAQQPGPFPRAQVIAWADQLLDALIYLHSRDRQVIHRDIKPHNLKLTATGQIALLDFGLARAQPADQSLTASRAFFGYTKHYAPLEQIQDQRTDQRSDIYALGATLYHLLTGSKPPDAMVRATALINAEPDPLKPADHIHPAVGPEISGILSKAMAQRSEDRFASAAEFREVLRAMGRARVVPIEEGTPTKLKAAKPEREVAEVDDGPVLKMQMVASARRFGPGAMTAVLLLIAALATGLVYASQHWSTVSKQLQAPTVTNEVTLQRPGTSTRKVEKPRTNEGATGNQPVRTSETRTESTKKPQSTERPSDRSNRASSLETAATPKPTTIQQQKRSRPNAPSIRLPKPEVAEHSRLISYDSGAQKFGSQNAPPRFFRSADGTLTVQFSDGSVRTIRPGERSGR